MAAVDGSSVEIWFRVTEDIPLVREEDVHAIANGSFNFTKNGSELVFSISSVELYENEGNYTVFASNPAGHSQSTIFLDVQSKLLY